MLQLFYSCVYRIAESKKELANQYYSLKQYKKALVVYNEVLSKYSILLYKCIMYQLFKHI